MILGDKTLLFQGGSVTLIFHDLLGIVLEIYIDDIVVKSAAMSDHLADL
jgi:hypothetical protein